MYVCIYIYIYICMHIYIMCIHIYIYIYNLFDCIYCLLWLFYAPRPPNEQSRIGEKVTVGIGIFREILLCNETTKTICLNVLFRCFQVPVPVVW